MLLGHWLLLLGGAILAFATFRRGLSLPARLISLVAVAALLLGAWLAGSTRI